MRTPAAVAPSASGIVRPTSGKAEPGARDERAELRKRQRGADAYGVLACMPAGDRARRDRGEGEGEHDKAESGEGWIDGIRGGGNAARAIGVSDIPVKVRAVSRAANDFR
jgi:hypothetical protein